MYQMKYDFGFAITQLSIYHTCEFCKRQTGDWFYDGEEYFYACGCGHKQYYSVKYVDDWVDNLCRMADDHMAKVN